jgi:hypothetical protein
LDFNLIVTYIFVVLTAYTFITKLSLWVLRKYYKPEVKDSKNSEGNIEMRLSSKSMKEI